MVLSNSVFLKDLGVYNTTEKRRRVIKKGTLYHKTLQLPLVSCTTGIFSKLAEDYSGQDTIYFPPSFPLVFLLLVELSKKGKKIPFGVHEIKQDRKNNHFPELVWKMVLQQ